MSSSRSSSGYRAFIICNLLCILRSLIFLERRRAKERPRRSPGEPRIAQGSPREPRRAEGNPREPSRAQESPAEPRRAQESTSEPRRTKETRKAKGRRAQASPGDSERNMKVWKTSGSSRNRKCCFS